MLHVEEDGKITLVLDGTPPTEVAADIIYRLFPEWWELFVEKNRGYGQKMSSGGGLGIKATIPDIIRKMGKIERAVWWGEELTGEQVREITMDLIGHLFLFLNHMDKDPLNETVKPGEVASPGRIRVQ